jgi:hypothetical protein
MNTFLLSCFIARLLFYFIFYGEFDLDLMILTGLIGMSLSLNGGVRQEAAVTVPAAIESTEDPHVLQPAWRRYSGPEISRG